MGGKRDDEDHEPRRWITWAYLLPGLSLYFLLPRERHLLLSQVLTGMIVVDALIRTWLRRQRRAQSKGRG